MMREIKVKRQTKKVLLRILSFKKAVRRNGSMLTVVEIRVYRNEV
jgi:hypothetical protein